jgi:ribose-phosphate pyrophosphokinase
VEGLKERGAKDVIVCATHPVFSGDAISKMNHPNIREVIVTDTISLPHDAPEKFKVISVSGVIADAIEIIAEGGSISSLFESGVSK